MRTCLLYGLLTLTGTALFASCSTPPQNAATPARPVPVTLLTAGYESVPDVIEAPGSVQPRNRIVLSAQISGSVRELWVRAGDSVRAGQLLATLDARDADSQRMMAGAAIDEAKAALDEAGKSADMAVSTRDAAKAQADLAGATYARYQKLFAARSLSPQELDEVRARRDGAAADLAAKEAMVAAAQDRLRQITARIAQANAQAGRADVVLSWTVVKAPCAGTVAERVADPGSNIFPGSTLIVLETTHDPQVVADFPTNRSQFLRRGLEVQLGDAGESGSVVTGRISEIIPVSNPASHTVQFKVDLPAGFSAPAGRFVKVIVPAGTRQAILVPRQAVRESGQLTGVFVIDGASAARLRLVKTASVDSERIELLSGVDPGEKIVSSASSDIVDGTPLEVRR